MRITLLGTGCPAVHPCRFCCRLLHSTGDVVIADRATALARLAGLPGGKLFALPAGEA